MGQENANIIGKPVHRFQDEMTFKAHDESRGLVKSRHMII